MPTNVQKAPFINSERSGIEEESMAEEVPANGGETSDDDYSQNF